MKERLRTTIDTLLFGRIIPRRIQALVSRQAILYIFYGCISATVDLSLFYICGAWFGLGYILSATVSFVFSSTTNFVTNKYLNYQNNSQRLARQYGVHFLVGLSSLLITYLFLAFFIGILGFGRMVSKVIIAFIVAFYSYSVHTRITFSQRHFSE